MTDTVASAPSPAGSVVPEPEQSAPPASQPEVELPEDRFSNREMSWLNFNARVLALAEDRRQPLLERMKFLAIFASNLDEFYMVRVAGLKRRLEMGLAVRGPDGLTTRETLMMIGERSRELMARHSRCFDSDIEPALAAEGIRILNWEHLDPGQQRELTEYFHSQVFPVLTPLAVDPAHPFPYISGLSLNLAVLVREPGSELDKFARVKVPNNVPRFVMVDKTPETAGFLPLEELIAAHLSALFPGMHIVQHHLFRVTRNTDFEVEEDRDEDLLQALERELVRRRFGPAVRLEVADNIAEEVLDLLTSEIDVQPEEVLRVPGLLDLGALWQVYDLDRPSLKEKPFVPATHPRFVDGETPKSVFATLRDGDVLVHHPYESFATSVQRFIEQAAADPNVLAIKQTLYRTSGDSPIVDALIDAAEAGKQVMVLVEIKARFDEQANIKWAKALERAGCHVVYGLVGLKTHCKTSLVVRSEGGSLRRYAHIGTGNYHPKTARLYEDLGLFTADEKICADLTDLFNVLTGYSRQTEYRTLLVAPQGLRPGLLARIEREIAHARAGRAGHIQIKCNHLVDETLIDALYQASQAGVRVELMVRTFCTIKAGVPGLSENITVRSVLGRFLEHSRIFYFANDDQPEYWIGSADLMHRNLDRRVEVLTQVTGANTEQLRTTLDLAFDPETTAWELQPDDQWIRRGGSRPVDYQQVLLARLASRGGT
ncbi:RNA degradosome polyphosphate kinase [Jatrophihabitans sp.]|uniref:RNA degradosome polyphosphate kinase n=1 Tax=Jatrophihabitans sp. TaxID=1932789 RepID=UPI002C05606B|nr:RNA degradosome polyphosphate kinase [Jatrophihabitans sp.]